MDDFNAVDWISVPNAPYIMKYFFHDTGYHVMVSNLTSLYCEKLEETNILKRFCDLNPFAQMKLPVILENLRKSLEKYLAQETEFSMNLTSDKLLLSLEFSAGLVSCKYNLELHKLDAEKITETIIAPTIFSALLSHRKILELQKKIMTYENTKSLLTPNISVSAQDPIDPDWLKGKNVCTENLLDSFLKIQSCSKDLYAENLELYNASRKEKSKNVHSVQSMCANKKFKVQENLDSESNSIKFEDCDERMSIIKEETVCNALTSKKKKKVFRI